ncbi:tRNA (adenosine(37)-N6)-threonylcarbamoyltransferase complex dimerization subunit type 1 TsaB [Glutamicibacter sp. MNS18]|uniref:tRNA (adenosine(37)-N6)-threonylcarbamoyltransferase complex dimerization subunit type 1 TsaB n=1 Tax=Glutamicibacter sp. MNS18 TaxID=2989817 RepID=UPI0022363131|nr:tRNA (adenosine(37)-N6)-threonylcarbamoyltransferase complex dimerization subunit type 1 TsaB [Glutamicibacter sp. MNS18]MCW4464201.1 tRNA (adenosine(37)-N6)-threonylcarbamoyltransferase complex dimerization subunit type 1 TsaB [Glutamicibacter sp. MNS18]
MSRYLVIDTSANTSVALYDEATGNVLAERNSERGNDQTETLAGYVQDVLADTGITGNELAGIIAGTGPGPFTGLRVGLVAARTFSYVWSLPLHGAMSLGALAHRVTRELAPTTDFLVATDARRREVYWARFGTDGTRLDGPHVGPAAELPALPVHGVGAGLYTEALAEAGATVADTSSNWLTRAADLAPRALADLATGADLSSTAPLYLRESDAQVPAFMKQAKG